MSFDTAGMTRVSTRKLTVTYGNGVPPDDTDSPGARWADQLRDALVRAIDNGDITYYEDDLTDVLDEAEPGEDYEVLLIMADLRLTDDAGYGQFMDEAREAVSSLGRRICTNLMEEFWSDAEDDDEDEDEEEEEEPKQIPNFTIPGLVLWEDKPNYTG